MIHSLHPVASPKELIRLGSEHDGGYLVPDDLEGLEACYSPGISKTADFELDCAERGIEVYLADYSVKNPPFDHPSFHFIRKHIGSSRDEKFTTFEEWLANTCPAKASDLMLQMDIEGSEYEVLHSMTENLLARFRIIVIEFHDLEKLWSKPFFRFAERAFKKLLINHSCVHIHPNNCAAPIKITGISIPPVMEFTFLRKDRIDNFRQQVVFPHRLDRDNTPNASIVLPKSWHHENE